MNTILNKTRLIILSAAILSFGPAPVVAGGMDGTGGNVTADLYTDFSVSFGHWLWSKYKQISYVDEFSSEELSGFKEAIKNMVYRKIKIKGYRQQLFTADGEPVDALSFQQEQMTQIDLMAWQMLNDEKKQKLSLHENLVLVGMETTNDFHLTNHILKIARMETNDFIGLKFCNTLKKRIAEGDPIDAKSIITIKSHSSLWQQLQAGKLGPKLEEREMKIYLSPSAKQFKLSNLLTGTLSQDKREYAIETNIDFRQIFEQTKELSSWMLVYEFPNSLPKGYYQTSVIYLQDLEIEPFLEDPNLKMETEHLSVSSSYDPGTVYIHYSHSLVWNQYPVPMHYLQASGASACKIATTTTSN